MKIARLVLLMMYFGAAALLLSGCGDDKPYSGPDPNQVSRYAAPAPAPLTAASSAPALPSDDPLVSGSGSISTTDPLLPRDTPAQTDPLAGSDPLQGPAMPTEHSHWLNTEFSQAQVFIRLNGLRLSSYQPSGTEDITMKLHSGLNTLTVLYVPRSTRSWSSVILSEGEHQGRAVPLAIFRRTPAADSVSSDTASLKSVTQTFTFLAK